MVLVGLRSASPKIFFALMETLFSAGEKGTIEKMQEKFLARYVHNGYQTRAWYLRTSWGEFY